MEKIPSVNKIIIVPPYQDVLARYNRGYVIINRTKINNLKTSREKTFQLGFLKQKPTQ